MDFCHLRIVVTFGLVIAIATGIRCVIAAEPFGAEDYGAQDNRPSIPEPLVFDLVRGLGAERGELEINVLGEFPLGKPGRSSGKDPFGISSFSEDRGQAEWAPEIEFALFDGFALEFELPFEGSELEAYKFAAQYTFGTALNQRFIDGMQVILEPDRQFDRCGVTALYLFGLQANERFSLLGMLGGRSELGGQTSETEGIFNMTLFCDTDSQTTLGIESNLFFGGSDAASLLLIPQVDREITDHFQIQFGTGVGLSSGSAEPLAAVRVIYSQ